MDNKVLEVALQAYMDGWCKSVEGTKRCIATWDDETDVAHARAGVRAALLAALPVLLGEVAEVVGEITDYIDQEVDPELDVVERWRDQMRRYLNAPSLGEGDGR